MPKTIPAKKASKISVAFLYDDTLDNDAGVAQYVKAVGGWLSGQGHNVSYLVGQSSTASWQGGQVFSLAKNLQVRWNGNRLSISVWPNLDLIKKVLQSNKFDVVHVMVPYSPFMSQRVISRLDGSSALVGSFHIFPANWASSAGSHLLKLLYGHSLKRFDAFLSVSTAAQNYAKKIFKLDSIISPNVVDVARFKSGRGQSGPTKRIVFLGRLVERKGCRQLINAFAKMDPQDNNAELVIAGDGPLRPKLEALCRARGIANRVKFLGYINEADKPDLLAGADIACFPSLGGESFGIVLIEAMAAGSKVVLGGNNPGYSCVLGGKPELLIDPQNSKEFAAKLKKYLVDAAAIASASKWQAEQAENYDVNKVGQQLLQIYERAIAKRSDYRA